MNLSDWEHLHSLLSLLSLVSEGRVLAWSDASEDIMIMDICWKVAYNSYTIDSGIMVENEQWRINSCKML